MSRVSPETIRNLDTVHTVEFTYADLLKLYAACVVAEEKRPPTPGEVETREKVREYMYRAGASS